MTDWVNVGLFTAIGIFFGMAVTVIIYEAVKIEPMQELEIINKTEIEQLDNDVNQLFNNDNILMERIERLDNATSNIISWALSQQNRTDKIEERLGMR